MYICRFAYAATKSQLPNVVLLSTDSLSASILIAQFRQIEKISNLQEVLEPTWDRNHLPDLATRKQTAVHCFPAVVLAAVFNHNVNRSCHDWRLSARCIQNFGSIRSACSGIMKADALQGSYFEIVMHPFRTTTSCGKCSQEGKERM
jgi:hypothetical protein